MALSPIKENQIYAHKPYVIMSPEGQAVNGGRMVLHAGEKAECEELAEKLYSGSDCPVEKREYPLAYNDNSIIKLEQEEPEAAPETMTYGYEPAADEIVSVTSSDVEPEDAPETMTYGQVVDALLDAKELEAHAELCLDLAKNSVNTDTFDFRTEQYVRAAQNAIMARVKWLNVRNDFESGK